MALKATFDRNKLYYDQKRKGDEFEVGDLVFTAQSALVTPGSAHNKELVCVHYKQSLLDRLR